MTLQISSNQLALDGMTTVCANMLQLETIIIKIATYHLGLSNSGYNNAIML